MFDPLFADITSGLSERIAGFVIKCLAVGGGFLLGYFLGGVVAWALNRWVFAQKAPDQLKKIIALLAGIALAIIVALIVFGEGGSGLFGGGGAGDGKTGPTPADDGKDKQAPKVEPKKDEKKEEPKKPVDAKPTPGDVRVSILSGDVKDGRFYLIEGDEKPKNFEEFKETITARRAASKNELTIVFRFQSEPLPDDHEAVTRAVAWVNEVKLLNRFE
jgi:hypothetical protein